MGGSPKKNRLRHSYEEGKSRDSAIEKMQDPNFQPEDLRQLVKKAMKAKAPEGASHF